MLSYKSFQLADAKADLERPGIFTGRASVYGVVDSYNDVVMPGSFTESLVQLGGKIKVLCQHDPHDVIGMADLQDSPDALLVTEGRLELDLQSARDTYTRVKGGLIDGISIGYETLEQSFKGSVRQLDKIKLWEVSLVTFPANSFARVTGVKSFPAQDLAVQLLVWENELKAGRMLSSGNLRLVQEAHDAGQAMVERLKSLIEAAKPEEDEPDDEAKQREAELSAAAVKESEALTSLLAGIKSFTGEN